MELMQQLTRNLRLVEPIVQHGLAELQAGLPITHTLREVALMGSLVGTGMTPTRAIRQVESVESALLGLPPGEAAETYHTGVSAAPYGKGAYGAAPMYGKGVPGTYGAQTVMPLGYGQQGALPFGYGQQAVTPLGYTQQGALPFGYGQQAVTPFGYGQQAVMPFGKGTGC